MPYAVRDFTCVKCGATFRRRGNPTVEQRCAPCAIDYAAEVSRQIAAREGEHYLKWLESMARLHGEQWVDGYVAGQRGKG